MIGYRQDDRVSIIVLVVFAFWVWYNERRRDGLGETPDLIVAYPIEIISPRSLSLVTELVRFIRIIVSSNLIRILDS